MAKKEKYDFRERVAVVEWYDGDTFWGVLDQGVGIFRGGGLSVEHVQGSIDASFRAVIEPVRMRCALIQAPELEMSKGVVTSEAGMAALVYAQTIAPPGVYSCITYKADDTFDRPLVDLILGEFDTSFRFSEAMLAQGHAVPYK